jgi:NADPH:quinone reductase-like Zn-dependent oxidoreductase
MKAIGQDRYGDADVLSLREVPAPVPGAGEVLVEVRAAGVDPGVWIFMTGRPYAARAAAGLRRPRVPVRGRAVAGVVAALGAGVTRFAVGDPVYGSCRSGSYAEYALAPERLLARMPADLPFEQAAAVPISAQTALQAVRGRVRPGMTVLVIGAAGGVGSYAVQLAAHLGARTTGVCGGGKADLVRSLGAVSTVDYTRDDLGPGRYDLIIDTAGCRPFGVLRRSLAPGGTAVLVGGGHDAGGLFGGYSRQLRAPFVALLTRTRFAGLTARERAADLDELTALIESGSVRPVIDRTFALRDAPAAIDHLAAGHPAGKVIITI